MDNIENYEDDLRWEHVGHTDDWEANSVTLVEIGARKIGVYFQNDRWYALKDRCPHAGAPLHEGVLSDGCIACPRHGWKFDLASGEGPGDCRSATYPVKIDGNRVLVGV